jgi:hypothetical protein
MAIDRVDFPTTPNPVAGDWEKLVSIVSKSFQNLNDPLQIVGTNVPQGATFQAGGIVYYANADTAISGTESEYVLLTISGSTLVPSFVATLTGVTWNKIWNGYYDGSNNLYIFDETKAILVGDLALANSRYSKISDNPEFNSLVLASKTSDPSSPVAGQIWFRSDL